MAMNVKSLEIFIIIAMNLIFVTIRICIKVRYKSCDLLVFILILSMDHQLINQQKYMCIISDFLIQHQVSSMSAKSASVYNMYTLCLVRLETGMSAECFHLVTQSYKGSCMYCLHMTHDT